MKNYGGVSELTTVSGARGVFSTSVTAPTISGVTSLTISGIAVVTGSLTVRETDGNPHLGGVHTLIVSTGTLSNLGNGVVQISTGSAGSSTGITDHGDLTGLLADDHPQYLLTDGTRTFTGNQSLGGFNLTNIGTIVATTVTGTTGQFGGTLSAQNGSFSNSLTVSGQPVLITTVSGFPITVDKVAGKSLNKARFTNDTFGTNSFLVHSLKVPGGRMGTDGIIKTRVVGSFFNLSGAAKSMDIAVHFGNQPLYVDSHGGVGSSAGDERPLFFDFFIHNAGSTSLQFLDGHFSMHRNITGAGAVAPNTTSGIGDIFAVATSGGESTGSVVIGSGTVDTTIDQTLEVRFSFNTAAGTARLAWFERTGAYSYLLV